MERDIPRLAVSLPWNGQATLPVVMSICEKGRDTPDVGRDIFRPGMSKLPSVRDISPVGELKSDCEKESDLHAPGDAIQAAAAGALAARDDHVPEMDQPTIGDGSMDAMFDAATFRSLAR